VRKREVERSKEIKVERYRKKTKKERVKERKLRECMGNKDREKEGKM
jgi:hypothetical protein